MANTYDKFIILAHDQKGKKGLKLLLTKFHFISYNYYDMTYNCYFQIYFKQYLYSLFLKSYVSTTVSKQNKNL